MGTNLRARGWDDVDERGNFERLPANGYVCKIVNAFATKSKAGNDMLVTCVDVAEGKFAGHFTKSFNHFRQKDSSAKWPAAATMYQNYFDADDKVNSGLKGLLKSVERSNAGFVVNIDDFEPASLRGQFIGVIFGEEEYRKKDGSIGVNTRATFPRDVSKIREGDFNIPDVKRLDKDKNSYNAPPPKTSDEFDDFDIPPF